MINAQILLKRTLTLKAPSKECSRQHVIFFIIIIILSELKCQALFSLKKKLYIYTFCIKLLSVAAVVDAFSVNTITVVNYTKLSYCIRKY